eukprot:2707125-Prorocentrum_lima.AAC.1
MVRSGRPSCNPLASHGIAKKCRLSLPQTPKRPREGPTIVGCWHGLPATMRRRARGGSHG